MALADADGKPQCSYKGDKPGFLRALDDHNIAFAAYDGNGMFLSVDDLLGNPRVGLLFIDFLNQRPLRLNGLARMDPADPLVRYAEAQLIIRVRITEIFPNCPRCGT
jgi:uncharacterized protein